MSVICELAGRKEKSVYRKILSQKKQNRILKRDQGSRKPATHSTPGNSWPDHVPLSSGVATPYSSFRVPSHSFEKQFVQKSLDLDSGLLLLTLSYKSYAQIPPHPVEQDLGD